MTVADRFAVAAIVVWLGMLLSVTIPWGRAWRWLQRHVLGRNLL